MAALLIPEVGVVSGTGSVLVSEVGVVTLSTTPETGDGIVNVPQSAFSLSSYAADIPLPATLDVPLATKALSSYGPAVSAVACTTFSIALTNPGAETGDTTGWTNTTGVLAVGTTNNPVAGDVPASGTYFFYGGAYAITRAYQDVAVPAGAYVGVDAHLALATISWQHSSAQGLDDGSVVLEFYDNGMGLLDSIQETKQTAPIQPTWEEQNKVCMVPVGTRTIRVILYLDRDSGTQLNYYIDDIALSLCVAGAKFDLVNGGAESGDSSVGWTNVSSELEQWSSDLGPRTGTYYFRSPFGETVVICQDVSLTDVSGYLATKGAVARLPFWARSVDLNETISLEVKAYDSGDSLLSTQAVDPTYPWYYLGDWKPDYFAFGIPVGTAWIRLTLTVVDPGGGSFVGAEFDDIGPLLLLNSDITLGTSVVVPKSSFTLSGFSPSLFTGLTGGVTVPLWAAQLTSSIPNIESPNIYEASSTTGLEFTDGADALISLALLAETGVTLDPTVPFNLSVQASDSLTLGVVDGTLVTISASLEEAISLSTSARSATEVFGTATTSFIFYLLTESPDTYEVWTMNTDTLAMTQYQGVGFNSYMALGGRTFGVRGDGLYELSGMTDNESEIEAYVRTGLLDFGTYAQKNVYRAFMYLKSDEPVYLKTLTDERGTRKERWYEVSVQANTDVPHSRMVRLPRGVTAVRWGFEIRTIDGGALDLLGFEVHPVELRRIVGR